MSIFAILLSTLSLVHATCDTDLIMEDQPLNRTFELAMNDLERNLLLMQTGTLYDFANRYSAARSAAFKVEELARFYYELPGKHNEDRFREIHDLAKQLEDKLGEFNEYDELYKSPVYGVEQKESLRKAMVENMNSMQNWLRTSEPHWQVAHKSEMNPKDFAVARMRELLGQVKLPSTKENREYAAKRMVDVILKVDKHLNDGDYSPGKKGVYKKDELESKAHQLRRDIRRITMVMAYSTMFELRDDLDGGSDEANALQKVLLPLEGSDVASSPFAKLPKATIRRPIAVPRALFLAITQVVAEFGAAKDGAVNTNLLHEMGLSEEGADMKALTEKYSKQIEFLKSTGLLRLLAEFIEQNAD
jgi:hypothetical protein